MPATHCGKPHPTLPRAKPIHQRTTSSVTCKSPRCTHDLCHRTSFTLAVPAIGLTSSHLPSQIAHNRRMSASPTPPTLARNASSPAPTSKTSATYTVSPLQLPANKQLGQDEPRRPSIQFLPHRNTSLPRGNPKPGQRRRLSSPPPPPYVFAYCMYTLRLRILFYRHLSLIVSFSPPSPHLLLFSVSVKQTASKHDVVCFTSRSWVLERNIDLVAFLCSSVPFKMTNMY